MALDARLRQRWQRGWAPWLLALYLAVLATAPFAHCHAVAAGEGAPWERLAALAAPGAPEGDGGCAVCSLARATAAIDLAPGTTPGSAVTSVRRPLPAAAVPRAGWRLPLRSRAPPGS